MPDRIRYHTSLPGVRIASSADAAAIKTERDRFYSSARWRKLRAFLARNP